MRSTKRHPFRLQDQGNNFIHQSREQAYLLRQHYQQFYNSRDVSILPWHGSSRSLQVPITSSEVAIALQSLSNGRASGPDGLHGELFKYGGVQIYDELAAIYNYIFLEHSSESDLNIGHIICLNKSNGKPPTVSNSRPICLVNVTRKILSKIVLLREDSLESYLSHSQAAFHKKRSTSDVLWSYKFVMATVVRYQEIFYVMGLDLAKAFDTVDREKLLEIVSSLVDESEFRIIRYLLADVHCIIKLNDIFSDSFSSSNDASPG